jgi:Rieske 2Fe-2S family protein
VLPLRTGPSGAWTFTRSGTSTRPPFEGLNDKERDHHKGEIVYPNPWISLAAEHVAAFTLYPRSVSEIQVVCDFLFHRDEVAKAGFDPGDVVEFWDVINRQDWAVCESVQRGISSRGFRQGLFAPMEDASADIRRYTARLLKS